MRRLVVAFHHGIQSAGRTATVVALLAIMVLLALGILVRAVPIVSLAGYDEVVELLVAWMTFLGAALLLGEGSLYCVGALTDRLPPGPAWVVAFFVRVLILLFAVVFTVEGWHVATRSAETTTFLRFPKSIAYASMPVTGLLMIAYAVSGIWQTLAGIRQQR